VKTQIENKNVKQTLKNIAPIALFIIVLGLLTLIFLPEIKRLATPEGREAFKLWVDSLGFLGWLVSLGIQLLQIFVAFIPGEPVELMLGYVWGPWLGTFTCLLGIFIGTALIYFFVKKLGRKFVVRAVGEADLTKYKFLSNRSRAQMTVFILFFIPGTPKDALTYIAPLAPIPTVSYLLITTFARIPSIVTSTIQGMRAKVVISR
jgi:uncharacterized membrane protein YdjX (TVP38/TMEM64 family)